jgi:hypothetical protein
MISKPPPFKGYAPVASDDLWAKILSGEIAPLVYSSEARGDLGPVAISPAEFFRAHEAGQEDGEPDPMLEPFQIMWRDRDRRRPSATRRGIPVPHWVYVAQELGKSDCREELPRRRASKEEIREELRAVYAAAAAPPNIKQAPKLVKPRLHSHGLEASERYIAEIADETEFAKLRRAPGRTIASERPK